MFESIRNSKGTIWPRLPTLSKFPVQQLDWQSEAHPDTNPGSVGSVAENWKIPDNRKEEDGRLQENKARRRGLEVLLRCTAWGDKY